MTEDAPFDEASAVRQIVLGAVSEAGDEDWDSITYRLSAVSSLLEDQLIIVGHDGSSRTTFASADMARVARRLRAEMYRPGAGTWFSAKLTVNRPGSVDVDFNYDNEPIWSSPVDPKAYAHDMEKFPRDVSAVPSWLSEQLAAARA